MALLASSLPSFFLELRFGEDNTTQTEPGMSPSQLGKALGEEVPCGRKEITRTVHDILAGGRGNPAHDGAVNTCRIGRSGPGAVTSLDARPEPCGCCQIPQPQQSSSPPPPSPRAAPQSSQVTQLTTHMASSRPELLRTWDLREIPTAVPHDGDIECGVLLDLSVCGRASS